MAWLLTILIAVILALFIHKAVKTSSRHRVSITFLLMSTLVELYNHCSRRCTSVG